MTRVLAGVALALVAGCDVSVSEEDELGDQYAAAIASQVDIIDDSAATAWLSTLGFRLTSVADTENRDWHFYLVDDSTVNAFAVPGGHIFVHRGLIERAGTYAELAGVLGHEVAHVTLRHSVDQMKSRTRTGVLVTVFCAVVNICSSTAAQVAIDVGGQALFAKYSRDDEAQADSAGVGYLVAAGINPRGIPSMFERLAAARRVNPTALDAWFGSHPLEQSRVARTTALISTLGPAVDSLVTDEPSFAAFREAVSGLSASK
ncbi:MAG TPA: M48 family metallopeptidase [Gemmatimonadaceae bacterium]